MAQDGRRTAETTHDRLDLPEDLGAVMGRIARRLQEEHGHVDATLHSITTAAVSTVAGAEFASVSLVRRRRVESRGATSEQAREIDQLQTDVDEGPCLDALRHEETVRVPDFATEQRLAASAAK